MLSFQALTCCHDLDIWLAAHLADVFDKLAMVPDEDRWVDVIVESHVAEFRRFDMSLRDYFLLEYTDVLSGNDKHNHLWKVIADYLNAAGDEGRRCASSCASVPLLMTFLLPQMRWNPQQARGRWRRPRL